MADRRKAGEPAAGRFAGGLLLFLVAAVTGLIVWLTLSSREKTWPPTLAVVQLDLDANRKLAAARAARERQEAKLAARARKARERESERISRRQRQKWQAARRQWAAREAERQQRRTEMQPKPRRRPTAPSPSEVTLSPRIATAPPPRAPSAHPAEPPPPQVAELAPPSTPSAHHARPSLPPHIAQAPKPRPEPQEPAPTLEIAEAPKPKPESHDPAPQITEAPPPGDHEEEVRPPEEPHPPAQIAEAPPEPAHEAPVAADTPPARGARKIVTESRDPNMAEAGSAPPAKASGAPQPLAPASMPGKPDSVPALPARNIPTPPVIFQLAQRRPDDPLKPVPDPDLVEETEIGPLPIVGKNGKRAWKVYARPYDGDASRPRVAIIIGGLGMNRSLAQAAIDSMPANVTLAFVPYAPDLEGWAKKARGAGHEFLLNVPMEPQEYPTIDPGPQALLTSLQPSENHKRLLWSLGRVSGYFGVADYRGSRFTLSRVDMLRLFRELKKRGLAFVDTRSGARSIALEIAREVGLPLASSAIRVDTQPNAVAIDRDLKQLELFARNNGAALGTASPLPVTFARLAQWISGLEKKGLELVPASALVREETNE